MSRGRSWAAAAIACVLFLVAIGEIRGSEPPPAPEFPTLDAARWVGTPVRIQGLLGRVVLLDVWTFG